MPDDVVAWVDRRTGGASFARRALRYVFPDHWSFLLGEVALYSFVVLVGTGVFLALFFEDSTAKVVYHGAYAPLDGFHMTRAYASVLHLSWDVKAGLLMRQTHHWAANVFVAAIVLHLIRIFFTGAFRRPREATYLIGLLTLLIALPEGYLGYSLADDLLSGMGLAIGYAVALSFPVIGGNLANAIWGAPFPGAPEFWSRMYVAHVFVIPAILATLLVLHLVLVASRHHTQFRESERHTEQKVVGSPMLPSYAPRSIALFLGVAAVLFLLGGLVQINPIWQWGPYSTALSTNAAQPDWYLGWLIGALRIVPGFDLTIGHYTLVANPFWGGALFPLVVFAILGAYPFYERRRTKDDAHHNLLDRPRDNPRRTAFGAALLAWVLAVFFAGSADRAYVTFGLSYTAQIWVYRALVVVAPLAVYAVTRRVCRELQAADRVEFVSAAAAKEAELATASRGAGRTPASPPGPRP
jgi:ubiquinol-cytochrome c reductase cytochrome b subunit